MWGQDWGALVWSSQAVPLMGPAGWLLLGAAMAAALLRVRRRAPGALAGVAVLAVAALPLAALAAQIVLPHTFSNGTPADADEVNENFDVLVVESNDQDDRIGALETGVQGYEIRQLPVNLAASPASVSSQAPCPAGKRAVGGGYELDVAVSTLRVLVSAPNSTGSAWRTEAALTWTGGGSRTITLFAVCVDGS